MELTKEQLAQRDAMRVAAGRSVPLVGGDAAPFAAARAAAQNSLGLFANKTRYKELYRYFSQHAQKWLAQQWHAPKSDAPRIDVINCIAKCGMPDLGGYKVYVYNGRCFVEEGGALAVQPNGVVYGSLAEAAKRYPQIVAREYAKQSAVEDDLVRLNTLQAEDGIFIYIPEGVRVEQPIQVMLVLDASQPQCIDFRNLVVVEELGDASVVYCDYTHSPVPCLTQQVTECAVGCGANLDLTLLQCQHDGALQLHHVFANLLADSHLHASVFTLHGGAVRNNLYLTLLGQNAEATCNGLALINKEQFVDMHTLVRHAAPQCQSNQLYKTIINHEGESNFYGIIDVQRGAQKTIAYQRNANILMSTAAKAHTRPQLIIHADDVKCSHGATVGQFDDEVRFYMMQRGLSPEEANRLLMLGFADDVICLIPEAALQAFLRDVVERRLAGEAYLSCHCPEQDVGKTV